MAWNGPDDGDCEDFRDYASRCSRQGAKGSFGKALSQPRASITGHYGAVRAAEPPGVR